ncbi:hypothetical protein W04_3344 [Pseudoalteromonas sp. SW0106-04]|uniref:hypothetical protein n=1 Tax=Pseudoalteromonas sp. SW0106-04 TaxID=1702169 RepID=UPI0006B45109|nr:hypothetical protein [Pseudoalteromonas sp. SW0106-04]GAP76772.1 hypothetical protein W04_3344 [Pseudoalteromonas sp. SW0106-04]
MSNQQISPVILKSDSGLGNELRLRLDALISGVASTSITYFDSLSFESGLGLFVFCWQDHRLVSMFELPPRQYRLLKTQAKALGLEQLKEPA